ncbi:MAG: ExbD/TolR family protein [Myxococcota bacterium]
MNFKIKVREEVRLELTPLIDVTFQLILFFMVSTNFNEAPGIEVELPQASTEQIIQDSKDLEIWLTADSELFVEQTPVDKAELKEKIALALQTNQGVLVVIKADEDVAHARVVEVMDLAQELGVQNLSIGTKPK